MFNFFKKKKLDPQINKSGLVAPITDLKDLPKNLRVNIHSREGVLFNGEADALSASNDAGVFDILPMHSRFVATFSGDIILHQGKTDQKIALTGGVIRVVDNQVEVFVGV